MSYENYDIPESDPYCIDGSTCLTNLLGLTDTGSLNQAEQDLSALAMIALNANPVPATFDLDHLKELHRRLFGYIYPWAGDLRVADYGKGGMLFLPHHLIDDHADALFGELRSEGYLRSTSLEDLPVRLAYYLGRINAIHPFREGNGRTQRIFIDQLSVAVGYVTEWSGISGDAMAKACRSARTQNPIYTDLTKLIRLNLSRLD